MGEHAGCRRSQASRLASRAKTRPSPGICRCVIPGKKGSSADHMTASGDIRNVVLTVNELPDNYSGQLDITINDSTPFVTLRNILLILILGRFPDFHKAADMAAHVWYSTLLPTEYHNLLKRFALEIMENRNRADGMFSLKLGRHTTMDGIVEDSEMSTLAALILSKYSAQDVKNTMTRVQCV
jgi:hypothetical protein